MDFRSCPACKASVLEDDVDECPFCGASMSGKPSSAPSSKAAAAKPATSRPAGKPTGKATATPPAKGDSKSAPARPGSRPTAAPKAESDDPFEVDTSAMRRAIKLAPRPTKTRTYEVVCPMCETHGYLPLADAGKDVQCCNPECLVPIFKSQRPAVEEVVEEEPKSNRTLMYGGGLLVVIVIGVCVWFFVLAPEDKVDVVVEQDAAPVTPIEDLHLTPTNQVKTGAEAPPASLADIRKKSLERIVDAARQRDRNRSADYGTQLAAEAFAVAGDLTQARDQIRRLQSKAPQAPYLQIQPLVDVGWQQLAAGQTKEAQQTAESAESKAKNLPVSIRKTLDAATSLAALELALGNDSAAEALIRKEQDRGSRGRLSMLWRAAVDGGSFQIDQEAQRPWHVATPEPMRVAIIETLVTHGKIDEAEASIARAEDVASQSVCQAAWAARLTQTQPQQVVARLTSRLQSSRASAAAQAQAWGAVASMAWTLKKETLQKTAFANGQTAAGSIQTPTTVALPSLRELHDSEGKPHVGLPDPAPAHAAALAVAGLAIDQLQAGQREAGWATLQKALDLARGMTPSPAATRQLVDECQHQEASLRSQLNQALNLGNNDQKIRAAFIRYRHQCVKLNAEAEERLNLQVTLLKFAVTDGLGEEVWNYARERNDLNELQKREPYLTTSLPGLILSFAQAEGKSDLASAVQGAYTDQPIEVDPLDAVFAGTLTALRKGQFSQASDIVERAYRTPRLPAKDPERLDEIALRSTGLAQLKASSAEMIDFIKNLYDVIVQEDAFLLMAAESMRRETASELWKVAVKSRDLAALDQVALYHGYVIGFPRDSKGPSENKPPQKTVAATR